MTIYIAAAVAGGLLAAWLLGAVLPKHLLYASAPFKADAVAVLIGPDEAARRKQADELIDAGWAKFLIVPWEGRIVETQVSRDLVTPQRAASIARGIKTDLERAYVQRTHIEVLQTRKLMEHIGATRVLFVSSPYHMRRIKIMSERFFDPQLFEMAYVPADQDVRHTPWFFSWKDIQWVFSEWAKILWFRIYAPFV